MMSEEIRLEGHIIDSLILSKVLDEIQTLGGDFRIKKVDVGQKRDDRSEAVIEVLAPDADQLATMVAQIAKQGAVIQAPENARLVAAEKDGVFPDGFYSTTNLPTLVRHRDNWLPVGLQEMDCGIKYEPATESFRCIPVCHIRKGDQIVVGHRGIKVIPRTPATGDAHALQPPDDLQLADSSLCPRCSGRGRFTVDPNRRCHLRP